MGHRDDFIACADAERTECEIKSVGAIADADTRLRFAIRGKLIFKTAHFVAADERAFGDDVLNRGVDLGFNRLILVEETDERNILGHLLVLFPCVSVALSELSYFLTRTRGSLRARPWLRSEERRVGKECRARGWPHDENKKTAV